MIDIWRKRFILSDSDQPTSLVDIRPTEERHGVLDPKTFEAIEAEALFETVDHTRTETGRLALYRSFASPQQDAQVLQQKQTALREIESNTPLREALERWVQGAVSGEKSLQYLLYGEFAGGLATDDPSSRTDKLEFGGFGYKQYRDGTQFVVDWVEGSRNIPRPQSPYLCTLLEAVQEFAQSRTYALIQGPVYTANGKFKTRKEKKAFDLYSRFRPSLLKLLRTASCFFSMY